VAAARSLRCGERACAVRDRRACAVYRLNWRAAVCSAIGLNAPHVDIRPASLMPSRAAQGNPGKGSLDKLRKRTSTWRVLPLRNGGRRRFEARRLYDRIFRGRRAKRAIRFWHVRRPSRPFARPSPGWYRLSGDRALSSTLAGQSAGTEAPHRADRARLSMNGPCAPLQSSGRFDSITRAHAAAPRRGTRAL